MYVDIKVGESLLIDDAKITLLSKTGQLARFKIDAPKSVTIKKSHHESRTGFTERR